MKIIKNGFLKNYIPSKNKFFTNKKIKTNFYKNRVNIFKRDNLIKFKSIMGDKIKGIVVEGQFSKY